MYKGKLAITVVALAISALCMHSINRLNSGRAVFTESEQNARNYAASSLYAKLTILEQPSTSSDITQLVHDFIRQDNRVDGATLFDSRGKLLAQLGNGNDSLLQHPVGKPVARIPIRFGDADAGHAILIFHSSQSTVRTAFHYLALAGVSVLLAMLVIGLLSMYSRVVFLLLKGRPDSA